jgi:hypothetical protein
MGWEFGLLVQKQDDGSSASRVVGGALPKGLAWIDFLPVDRDAGFGFAVPVFDDKT